MEAHKNNNKQHLEFDTEFLDEITPKTKPNANADKKPEKPKSDKKAIYWTVGIVAFLIIVGALSDKSGTTSSSSSSSSSSNYVQGNGQYSCSSYSSDRADALKPTMTKEALDAEESRLNARIAAIKTSSAKIDSAQVDESNQEAIDAYNQMVNDHNAELESIKRASATYQQDLDKFNAEVDAYNSYLEKNCTKRY